MSKRKRKWEIIPNLNSTFGFSWFDRGIVLEKKKAEDIDIYRKNSEQTSLSMKN